MSNKTLVTCGECGEFTPIIYSTDYMGSGVQHVYVECQSCRTKVTVYYTDKEIRQLLKKQEKTPAGDRKVELAALIDSKMQNLREQFE